MTTQQLAQGLELGLREIRQRQVRWAATWHKHACRQQPSVGLVLSFTHGCCCTPGLPWHRSATTSFNSMWADL